MSFLLLHGFTGTPESWAPIADELSRRGRVLAPAVGGHLDAPPPSSFEGEVDRLASIVVGEGLRDVHVCGYSLGGRLTLGLLARHPGLFRAVTLISAHPGLTSDDERRAREAQDERWAAKIEAAGVSAFVDEWESQPMFQTQRALPPDLFAAQRAARTSHSASGLAAAMRNLGLAKMPAYGSVVVESTKDLAIIVGERDEKFLGVARRLVRDAPHVKLTVVAGAGHNVLLERPEGILPVILRSPSTEA